MSYLNIGEVYITHYLPLRERKERLMRELPFEARWIEEEPTNYEDFVCRNKERWEQNVTPYAPYRELKKEEISIAYKHFLAYGDIHVNNVKNALIFEDDVVLDIDFVSKFNSYLERTPKDWDLIFMGSGCGLRVPKRDLVDGQIAYLKDHPASKCADSYCITNEAATKIVKSIGCFTFPVDFELNYWMKYHDMKVYWWEPSLTIQGSQRGLYKSEIQK